ncbi:MAG: Head fiber protein [Clostridia bacterium]
MEQVTAKNYHAHGGNEWVIGGKLTFLPGATVEGGDGLLGAAAPGFTQMPNQAASEATTIAVLKENFNTLLSALKTAGLMVSDTPAEAGTP